MFTPGEEVAGIFAVIVAAGNDFEIKEASKIKENQGRNETRNDQE